MRKSLVAVLVTCVLPVLVAHPAEATTPTSVTAYAGAISHETTTSVVAGDAVHLVGVYRRPGEHDGGCSPGPVGEALRGRLGTGALSDHRQRGPDLRRSGAVDEDALPVAFRR